MSVKLPPRILIVYLKNSNKSVEQIDWCVSKNGFPNFNFTINHAKPVIELYSLTSKFVISISQ